ncbi:MAG: pantoate--beta-alanine ligase, partial [Ilumatobacteraceae bacterium]
VNPLQFDRHDDFDSYPRPIDDDVARCLHAGVTAVYAPTASAMYPPAFQTHVEPGTLAIGFEGAMRPGHFRGVATVVTKLFAAAQPHIAVFGEKDFQQLAVVRQMTADLDLGITVVGVPTVREPDGLALSSRNQGLPPDDRAAASVVPRALLAGRAAAASGAPSARDVEAAVREVLDSESRANVEYVDVVDSSTLEPASRVDPRARLMVAVWFGDVRLIDNCALAGDGDLA